MLYQQQYFLIRQKNLKLKSENLKQIRKFKMVIKINKEN